MVFKSWGWGGRGGSWGGGLDPVIEQWVGLGREEPRLLLEGAHPSETQSGCPNSVFKDPNTIAAVKLGWKDSN